MKIQVEEHYIENPGNNEKYNSYTIYRINNNRLKDVLYKILNDLKIEKYEIYFEDNEIAFTNLNSKFPKSKNYHEYIAEREI